MLNKHRIFVLSNSAHNEKSTLRFLDTINKMTALNNKNAIVADKNHQKIYVSPSCRTDPQRDNVDVEKLSNIVSGFCEY